MAFVSEIVSALIIAIIQGITEWLPVSSSGHLVLFESLLNFKGGLVFDVALHFGTLMAVFVYFGKDIIDIIRDLLLGNWKTGNGRLGVLIAIATIPAAIVGWLFKNVFEIAFGSLGVSAIGFAVTGVFLIIASLEHRSSKNYDKKKRRGKKAKFGYGEAMIVGLVQVFALFPGISRSGSTLGTGLLLGLKEKEALRFSFLMSIPIIFGANILVIGNQTLPSELIWATLVSFIIGLVTIHLLYNYILTSKKNLKWFGIYALALALVLGILIVL